MIHNRLNRDRWYRVLPALLVALSIYSCASIGRPDGGPIDEDPPRFIESTPKPGEVKVNKSKFSLTFDEYIKLEKASEKVVISPPQIQQPEIKAVGKKIVVTLQDTLKPNSTYTVDFGDAIVDNNEGNPLGNFTYTFSTGDVIDSMEVAGTLLEAENLEPVKGMMVGLHSNLADSAFLKLPLDRVARTDSRGRFSIKGVAPGSYRIFGLLDADQNYAYSQKSEALAFNDSLIVPRWELATRQDTTWVDSLTIDTIVTRQYTHYLPDNLILRSFKADAASQYLVKNERTELKKFSLYFAAKADSLPKLKGLNFDEKRLVVQSNPTRDSITYWIADSTIYKMDTLKLSLGYLYTDTLDRLVPRTDTLNIVAKIKQKKDDGSDPKEVKKAKRKKDKDAEDEDENKIELLKVNLNAPGSMDIYGYASLEFPEPAALIDTSAIHLRMKVDTLWQDVSFNFEQDTTDIRRYKIYSDWDFEQEFEMTVDSAALVGLYGLHNGPLKGTFKVKSEEEYCNIFFNITGADSLAFVELLTPQDNVVRRIKVRDGSADFYFLAPGKYCARLINDRNGNGVWDTGCYTEEEMRQPEEVYYYNQIVEPKANWELNQDWNIKALSLDKQKPDEMKKQKPDEEKKKNRNAERERNKRK
jgi:hypothetical protein